MRRPTELAPIGTNNTPARVNLRPEDAQALLDSFLAGRSPHTLAAYRGDLADFARWLGEPDPQTATARFLSAAPGEAHKLALDYRNALTEAGLAPSTVNRRLAALRSLVTLGNTLGLVTWRLATKGVRTESYRDTRGPGVDPIRSALDALAAEGTPKALRNRAAVRLMFDIALRRGSVVSLDLEHLDLDAGTVSVALKGRGTERRVKTLPAPTLDALREWVAARGTEPGPLFVNFDRAGQGETRRLTGRSLHRITEALGLGHPHGLRHTAVTRAVTRSQEAGIPLHQVLDYSDHSSLAVLQKYLDNVTDAGGRIADLVADLGNLARATA